MITAATATIITISCAAVCSAIVAAIVRKQTQRTAASQLLHARTRMDAEILSARLDRDRLLDALDDAFLLVDSSSHICFANAAAHQLFAGRHILNRPVTEVFLDIRLTDGITRCITSGHPERNHVLLPQQGSSLSDPDARGVSAWIIDAACLPATDGHPPLTRVIVRDVTDAHLTAQIRKDFVANASHELRTPLAIINGYLENLLDDGMLEDSESSKRFLSIMRKHADRISRIVEDMLVISRLESGEVNHLKIEPFKIHECIHDVLERLESLIRTQQVEIALVIPDPDLITHGDRFYWTQVIFNLVENALKQNPHPGLRIEIGAQSLADGKQQIWVADNGIGIPAADLTHIFRRFYRVEKHHSQREIKGTGLGLSIVKRAIEAHGGSIHVTSTPGKDTRFLIEV